MNMVNEIVFGRLEILIESIADREDRHIFHWKCPVKKLCKAGAYVLYRMTAKRDLHPAFRCLQCGLLGKVR